MPGAFFEGGCEMAKEEISQRQSGEIVTAKEAFRRWLLRLLFGKDGMRVPSVVQKLESNPMTVRNTGITP